MEWSRPIAAQFANMPHRYENSRATLWSDSVTGATRQRWHSCVYPSQPVSQRATRDARLCIAKCDSGQEPAGSVKARACDAVAALRQVLAGPMPCHW